MFSVFVDTSAFYAVLDRDDENHPLARRKWETLLDSGGILVTTNYVMVETCALLQSRLGLGALRTFSEDILPVVDLRWITPEQHASALFSVIAATRRKLSLVDCVSFLVMRSAGIRRAFAFDQHYAQQGFELEG